MSIAKNDSGYFTLEASLILPFALGIILMVIRIWFFRYDNVLQDMDTGAVVVRASLQRDLTPDERADYVVSQMQGRYRDSYIAWNFGELNVRCGADSVLCETSGSIGSIASIDVIGGTSAFGSCVSVRSRTSPEEVFVIRTYRKVLGAGEAMEGIFSE